MCRAGRKISGMALAAPIPATRQTPILAKMGSSSRIRPADRAPAQAPTTADSATHQASQASCACQSSSVPPV